MKIKFLKRYNRILIMVLSGLGLFSACRNGGSEYGPPPNIDTPAEYGCPQARYVLKGTVISEMTKESIPKIKIISDDDTLFSDNNGKFTIERMTFPGDIVIKITLQDQDGKENGEYQQTELSVDFKDSPLTGGSGSWDKGEAVKEIEILLKPKK
jgi:putative lipoprotein (rSAM/lipoprotein system)